MPQTLDAVRPIRLVKVTGTGRAASRLWNEFIARYHYLGHKTLVGAQMRYAVQDREGRPLAMLGFSAAAWKTAPRDAFIGWSPDVPGTEPPLMVDNSRYLIMPWVQIPNLASHILSNARRQLPQDWQSQYNIAPVLMETFVETPRFSGITYKASGWIHVGDTQGRGRYDTKRDSENRSRPSGSVRSEKTGKEYSISESHKGHHAFPERLLGIKSRAEMLKMG